MSVSFEVTPEIQWMYDTAPLTDLVTYNQDLIKLPFLKGCIL